MLSIVEADGRFWGSPFVHQCKECHPDLNFLYPKQSADIGDEEFIYAAYLRHPNDSLNNKNQKSFVEELPQAVRSLFQEGRGYLVLDSSNEGGFSGEYFQDLHELADSVGISPSRVIWLNQNSCLQEEYSRWHEDTPYSGRITVLHYNSAIYNIHKEFTRQHDEKAWLHLFLSQGVLRSKYFLCLNNVPRANRIFVLCKLIEKNLMHKGLVSFLANPSNLAKRSNGGLESNTKMFTSLFEAEDQLLEQLPVLQKMLPLRVDDQSWDTMVGSVDKQMYLQSYFSVVTETDMSAGSIKRYTEKSIKPIIGMHPFVVVGNPGTLAALRRLGFKTFDGFIDESYDYTVDRVQRVHQVMKEVERLCAMDKDQIHAWYESLRPILVHNFQHFLRGESTKTAADTSEIFKVVSPSLELSDL